jgi:hypothetical protein
MTLLEEQKDGDNDDVQLLEFNKIHITKGERFYGFSEQFLHLDMKGKCVPILVLEQGLRL